MDGVVDYLSPAHGVPLLRKKKTWKPRFCRLDVTFHALEVFTDASMTTRKYRIALANAQIATADELGALLDASNKTHGGSTIALANARRCVIRVSERDAAASQQLRHHFVCCEVPAANDTVDVHASRQYMQQWLEALKRVARDATASTSPTSQIDSRELTQRLETFAERLHLSAHVVGHTIENKHSVFDVAVTAWVLQREYVDGNENDWQVVEYACAWSVRKTTADLQAFDAQLRQFYSHELRDVVRPATTSVVGAVHHLLVSHHSTTAESDRRVAAADGYVQQLLRLPALADVTSDGSCMLDRFLDVARHVAALQQQQREASTMRLRLRSRLVVPWRDREQFEELYRMYRDAAQAQCTRTPVTTAAVRPRSDKSETERRHGSKQHEGRHREHHHRSSSSSKPHVRGIRTDDTTDERVADNDSSDARATDAVRAPSVVEQDALQSPLGESVHERIAKIGQKLLFEAFTAPPLH